MSLVPKKLQILSGEQQSIHSTHTNLGQHSYQPFPTIFFLRQAKRPFFCITICTFPQFTHPKYCEILLFLCKLVSWPPWSWQKVIWQGYEWWKPLHIPLPFLWIVFMCICMAFLTLATKQIAMASERSITVFMSNMT